MIHLVLKPLNPDTNSGLQWAILSGQNSSQTIPAVISDTGCPDHPLTNPEYVIPFWHMWSMTLIRIFLYLTGVFVCILKLRVCPTLRSYYRSCRLCSCLGRFVSFRHHRVWHDRRKGDKGWKNGRSDIDNRFITRWSINIYHTSIENYPLNVVCLTFRRCIFLVSCSSTFTGPYYMLIRIVQSNWSSELV